MMKKILIAILLSLLPVSVFAQGLPLKDGTASTLATISSCGGSENCVKSTGPAATTGAGFQSIAGQTGAGTTSSSKRFNSAYVSEGGGLRQAIPHLLWDDTFNATAQNTSKYSFTATNFTGAQSGGVFITNNSGINTANSDVSLQTFKVFPLFAKQELRVNFSAVKTIAPQSNETIEIGLLRAVLPGRAAPTDGVFFRWNTSAELRGVVNYNGTETQTTAITSPSISVNHDYLIVVQTNTVYFVIDDSVVGTITLLTDATAQGQPMMAASVPLTIRHYIGAATPALTTQKLQVSDVFVTALGPELARSWETQKAGFGHMAYQGQNGGTMGTTANTLNAATPAAAALTNTAISTGSPVGLGGLAHILPSLTAGTDGILFSFQNPVGGVNQTPRNLIIKGVTIGGGVDLALTGGPLVLAYSLAYGHTAISMATAELGSFVTGTTKAPRRIWLGVHTTLITAAAGVALGPGQIAVIFSSPVVVGPGEFVAITVRNQGIVTSAGSVVITAGFDAYFE